MSRRRGCHCKDLNVSLWTGISRLDQLQHLARRPWRHQGSDQQHHRLSISNASFSHPPMHLHTSITTVFDTHHCMGQIGLIFEGWKLEMTAALPSNAPMVRCPELSTDPASALHPIHDEQEHQHELQILSTSRSAPQDTSKTTELKQTGHLTCECKPRIQVQGVDSSRWVIEFDETTLLQIKSAKIASFRRMAFERSSDRVYR